MASRHKRDERARFEVLETRLGYHFSNHQNLERALTHASFNRSPAKHMHYETLEFLGDRVLGLCVAEQLFAQFPDANEGELSVRLNALVSGKALAEMADELSLHEFIRTGGDLKLSSGKRMLSVRADVMEALIASIYLDGGLSAAKGFIARIMGDRINQPGAARRDSKTALQEWAHSKQLDTPKYREKEKTGPDHEPVFVVEVKVEGKLAGTGQGRSKRAAEQAAARQVLIREGVWSDE